MIKAARDEEMLHNDDTGMRVLKLGREPGEKRTGVFTGGIVSTAQGRKNALYFTGSNDVLKQRPQEQTG